MNRNPFSLGRTLAVGCLSTILTLPILMGQVSSVLEEQEKEIDRKQMREIHTAIMAYREKHGDLPNWLSDLVPDFLSDPRTLISPKELRTGESRLWGYDDPKLKTSYVYEFSGNTAGSTVNRNRDEPITMKTWKKFQMEEFGPAMPLLRCHIHDPVLNLSFSGDTYETDLFWENDPNTLALVKKLGPGAGSPDAKHLNLTLLTKNGEPIANAKVTATQRESEFFHLPPITFTTDNKGQCRVRLGRGLIKSVALEFKAEGFAAPPIRFEGGDGIAIPTAETVHLETAVTVGGLVAGENGLPIVDALVEISGTTQDVAGQYIEFSYDKVLSDSEGKWTSSQIGESFGFLSFKISHPEFRPSEYFQVDENEAGDEEVSRSDLLSDRAKFVLRPGFEIKGRVTSIVGDPINRAHVTLRDSEESPNSWSQITDEHGRYRFVVLEEGLHHLFVETPGFAPEYRRVEVVDDFAVQDFELSGGQTLEGQVLDSDGKPVPEAVVGVASWYQLPLLKWEVLTDIEGNFSWPNAPAENLVLQISKSGFNPSQMAAEIGSPIKARLTKTFLLTGKVVDGETGEAVPEFNVVRGLSWGHSFDEHVNWEFHNVTQGYNGALSMEDDPRRPSNPGMKAKFLVSAEGFLPQISAAIETTGWHEIDFKLEKGLGPHGEVLDSAGNPVEGAEVVMLGAGYVTLGKKKLERVRNLGSNLARTDARGHFQLPASLPNPRVAVIHDTGFVEIADFDSNESLRLALQPWGKINGVLKAGTKPWPGQEIMVSPRGAAGRSLNYDFQTFKTRSGEDGSFSFDNVPPGERQLVILVEIGEGQNRMWSHSHIEPIVVKSGALTEIVYGNQGRPVTGRLKLDSSDLTIDWNNGHRTLGTRQLRPPSKMTAEEQKAWYQSPEAIESRKNYRYYSFKINDDGTFRIENIPSGSYDLNIHLNQPGADRFRGRPIAMHRQEVEIPEFSNRVSDEPFDLGEISISALPQR